MTHYTTKRIDLSKLLRPRQLTRSAVALQDSESSMSVVPSGLANVSYCFIQTHYYSYSWNPMSHWNFRNVSLAVRWSTLISVSRLWKLNWHVLMDTHSSEVRKSMLEDAVDNIFASWGGGANPSMAIIAFNFFYMSISLLRFYKCQWRSETCGLPAADSNETPWLNSTPHPHRSTYSGFQ